MAQQHHEMTGTKTATGTGIGTGAGTGVGAAGDALTAYLQDQATDFLRSLRLHRESTTDAQGAEESLEAACALRRAARRIGATLHTFRPLLDPDWASSLRAELAWLSGTLAQEHAYATRLDRLSTALHRLSGPPQLPPPTTPVETTSEPAVAAAGVTAVGRRSARRNGWAQPPVPGTENGGTTPRGLAVGAAKAAALLERQLTLAKTRAHSTTLQAFGSSRFHAVADNVAVLASEVPLRDAARDDLQALAEQARTTLTEAVTALPLGQAGHPYNAGALSHGLAPTDTAPDAQDAPWLKVRSLLRLHRYAQEVLGHPHAEPRIADASHALNVHREAAAAAAAAAHAARTPRIAPATAYALGVLHADQRHEVEAARFAFHQAWLREEARTW
ncbi:CHAD domain-containing protein [Streptomyces sp. NPDC018029]|uniref:CHAD domain-containing protein n=1 Tax=Streptomyces sp. NPDC018029 TaxID=3365032 RepID=UPI0037AF1218